MNLKITAIRQDDTHRLIPSRYGEDSVLRRLAEDERELQLLFDLDGATNERLLGEANLLPGISVHELLFGVSYAHIVNAAFTHAHPGGSRFNAPERGAWYAGFELETAQAEVARFTKRKSLQEIDWKEPERFTFDDYLADFRADFHDIRGNDIRGNDLRGNDGGTDASEDNWLDPDSYVASQRLARELLASGSSGIVYPSVRREGGACIACFRPALVTNVRQGQIVTLTFRGPNLSPEIV